MRRQNVITGIALHFFQLFKLLARSILLLTAAIGSPPPGIPRPQLTLPRLPPERNRIVICSVQSVRVMVGTHSESGIDAEAKTRALDGILHSVTFARRERLKSLLKFLCESEMLGREADLTEYTIGVAALGKPADFRPLEDSTVRSCVYQLRQRLEKYYAEESPANPVHIELRKGSYVPRYVTAFAAQPLEPAEEVHPASMPEPAPEAMSSKSWRIVALTAFCTAGAIFVCLAVWALVVNPGFRLSAARLEPASAQAAWTPELEHFWEPFIGTRKPLAITYETRFFVHMGPLVVRDPRVNSLVTVESSEPLLQVQRLFSVHQIYGAGTYADVGLPSALFYLTRLLSSRVENMSVKSSRELSAPDIRDSNLLVLGKPWLDTQIARVLAAADLVDNNGRIVDNHPPPGERAEYKDVNDSRDPDGWNERYSLITLMPNPAGGGKLLALTASGSEQPAALAYYVTDPESARVLDAKLRAGRAKPPEYFQVLVRAQFKGNAPVRAEYVTHRALRIR